jgi:3alpha(or 20beta)-hydroxysteroid dehydrogenase
VTSLDGKVALVTGGAQGMGEAAVRALRYEGARVVIADVKVESGTALAEELGPAAKFIRLDVTEPSEWHDAVEQAENTFGQLGVLVNNAGIADTGPIEDWDSGRLQRVLDVNLKGVFNGIQAVTPLMKKAGGGSIINFGSLGGMKAFPLMSGYVASKWAVRGLTKASALELGPYRIRVNAVHPGQINTPMTAGVEFGTSHVALRRVGEPTDLASVVVFLAGDSSCFMTGADLVVDGGELAGSADWVSVPD